MLVYKSVRVCACVYVSVLVLLDKGCAAPENVMLGPTPSGDGLRSAPNTMSLRVYLLRTNAHIRSHFGSSNFSSRAPSLARAAILVHWNVCWRHDGHMAANVPKGLCVAAPFRR